MKKYSLRKKAIVALMLSAVMFLMACGGDNNQPTQDNQGQGGGGGGGQVAAAGDGERVIRINGSFPLQADPAVGSNAVEAAVFFNIYDPLVFTEIDGTIIPHVATEWSRSADGLVYTFTIREGIRFHDGTYLTAEDVAFSMNRMLAIGQGFAHLYTAHVEEAVATGSHTVEFRLRQPFGPFVSTLVRMSVLNRNLVMDNLAEGPFGEYGDFGTTFLLTNSAGSGPFRMTEMRMGESMTAERFEDYWLGFGNNPPELFQVLAVNDPAMIRTLMSRQELDITDEWQAVASLQMMEEMDGVSVSNMSTGAVITLQMNTRRAPTDCVYFRRALGYLFDYQTAVTNIYPGTRQAVGPVAAAFLGHDPDLYQFTFNIDRAREMLSRSIYYGELDQHPIDIERSADVADTEALCLLLQQAAAEVGITLNIRSVSFAGLIANATSIDTTAHITIMYPSGDFSEAGSVLSMRYHSSTTGTFQQYGWLLDPAIDAAIEASLAELDANRRFEMYREIQRTIIDLKPTIYVLEWPEMRAWQSGLFRWPEAEAAQAGGTNAPIMGRSIYLRTMEFFN